MKSPTTAPAPWRPSTTGRNYSGAIRGHWDASENGTHYRRDVTFGEDACGVSQRGAAQVLATLRNLALGLYELARARAPAGRGPRGRRWHRTPARCPRRHARLAARPGLALLRSRSTKYLWF